MNMPLSYMVFNDYVFIIHVLGECFAITPAPPPAGNRTDIFVSRTSHGDADFLFRPSRHRSFLLNRFSIGFQCVLESGMAATAAGK